MNESTTKPLERYVLTRFDQGFSKSCIAREVGAILRLNTKGEAMGFVDKVLYDRHMAEQRKRRV